MFVRKRVRLKRMLMGVGGHFRTGLIFTKGKEKWRKNDTGSEGRMTSVSVRSVYTCSLPPELRRDVKPFSSVLVGVCRHEFVYVFILLTIALNMGASFSSPCL